MAYSLINDGFEIVEGALSQAVLEELRCAVGELPSRHRGGARNLLQNSQTVSAVANAHSRGKLDDDEIEHWRQTTEEVSCCVSQGDVLVMRPLLLHASSPAKSPSHRRVIHIEYACGPLPEGLRWFEQPTQTLPATAIAVQPSS